MDGVTLIFVFFYLTGVAYKIWFFRNKSEDAFAKIPEIMQFKDPKLVYWVVLVLCSLFWPVGVTWKFIQHLKEKK